MAEKDIERKIKKAVEVATPDVLDRVLSQCDSNRKVMKMENNKKRSIFKGIIGVAAAIALVAVGAFGYSLLDNGNGAAPAPDIDVEYAVVTLDVNPSVEIHVTADQKVMEVKALNEDGKKVLGDMNFKDADVKVAVNAIVGSMVKNGYISELANSVLISVDSENAEVGKSLEIGLLNEVQKLFENDKFSGAVLSQSVNSDSAVKEKAKAYGISVGKVQLINKIVASDSRYSFEQLSGLSINELNLLSASGKEISSAVVADGIASEGKYIGRGKAKQIALNHAGVKESDIFGFDLDMDFDNGKMVYEIDFHVGNVEYEYDINALDGSVVKHEKEADDDIIHESVKPNNGDGAGNGAGNGASDGAGSYIGAEAARDAALKHAGLKLADVRELEVELDRDRGVVEYEVEFKSNGYEYDYEIDAKSGAIKHFNKEIDD